MLKVIIVSLANSSLSGGSVASRSNFEALRNTAGLDVTVIGPLDLNYATHHYLPAPRTAQKVASYARLRPAIDYHSALEAIARANVGQADLVFLDTSLLGPLTPALRKIFPQARIATFFHNIESAAYFSMMRRTSIPAWLRMLSVYRAERQAATASDYRIALSKADERLMTRLFGVESDAIWPITYPPADLSPRPRTVEEDYVLFVGGYYKPNLEAIAYLASRIASRVNKKVVVAGFGLGRIQPEYANNANLLILDSPPSLAALYQHASLVLAPIFTGGGIKTKIIEALSYGRPVVASREAAIGFESISADSLRIASSDDDYIHAINSASCTKANPAIIAEYERHFSGEAKARCIVNLVRFVENEVNDRSTLRA